MIAYLPPSPPAQPPRLSAPSSTVVHVSQGDPELGSIFSPYSSGENTKAQRGQETCPELHGELVTDGAGTWCFPHGPKSFLPEAWPLSLTRVRAPGFIAYLVGVPETQERP